MPYPGWLETLLMGSGSWIPDLSKCVTFSQTADVPSLNHIPNQWSDGITMSFLEGLPATSVNLLESGHKPKPYPDRALRGRNRGFT